MLIPWFPGILLFLSRLGRAQDQDESMMEWTTAYSLEGEHEIAKNTLLTTLPTLDKEWKVTFELNPTSYKYRGYAQVIHFTTGGKGGKGGQLGDRTPALWIHKTLGVYIVTTINGKPNVGKTLRLGRPPLNKWTTVEINQVKKGSSYIFSLMMNNEVLWITRNVKPSQFSDVKVYAASPWFAVQAGSIRGLKIEQPGSKESICILF